MYYYYDESGVAGFEYNGAKYHYIKNLQGDIVEIYDANGIRAVQYTYDAWGNVISITGSLASTVGQLNPFRYRGYYYDTETGFYYLQSRYYDPTVGRFLNADGIIGANGGILGYNMFAYCSNNPIMFVDYYGNCYVQVRTDEGMHTYDVACDCLAIGSSFSNDCNCISQIIEYVAANEIIVSYTHCSTGEMVIVNRAIEDYFTGKSMDGIDHRLIERLYIFGVEHQIESGCVSSGYRSIEEQSRLYEEYTSGKRTSPVAAPGKSWHNYGGAIDISSYSFRNFTNEEFRKYGLIRPVRSENWHFQIIETEGQKAKYFGPEYMNGIIKWGV